MCAMRIMHDMICSKLDIRGMQAIMTSELSMLGMRRMQDMMMSGSGIHGMLSMRGMTRSGLGMRGMPSMGGWGGAAMCGMRLDRASFAWYAKYAWYEGVTAWYAGYEN